MAIKYKAQAKVNPQNRTETRYYPVNIKTGNKNLEDLIPAIEKISTVSGADTAAVLYALLDVVPNLLADGNSVQLGGLGSIRVSIGGTGQEKQEEVTAANITKSKVLFTPGKKLKNMLAELSFKKI